MGAEKQRANANKRMMLCRINRLEPATVRWESGGPAGYCVRPAMMVVTMVVVAQTIALFGSRVGNGE
jgi:hypothetical protein